MKHLGWIIAGLIALWFFFFRGSGGSTGAFSSGTGNTSGGIDTGGTASPTGGAIPLTTVNTGHVFGFTPLPGGGLAGIAGNPPAPPATGNTYRSLPPVFGGSRTATTVDSTVGVVQVQSPPLVRSYYLPPAFVSSPIGRLFGSQPPAKLGIQ